MAHPFTKLFDAALRKSTLMDNRVLHEAEQLHAKGYSTQEIYEVLRKMEKALVRSEDEAVLKEAAEEMSRYLD